MFLYRLYKKWQDHRTTKKIYRLMKDDVQMWYRFGYSEEEIIEGYVLAFKERPLKFISKAEHEYFIRNLPGLIRSFNPHHPKPFVRVS